MTNPFHFKAGHAPLLISMPHVGTTIPAEIGAEMDDIAQVKKDTDWHLPLLYNMAEQLGASVISAEYSRYVIDLNRPKEDSNLYPGQDTTGLCPVDTFGKQDLYRAGHLPDAPQIADRIEKYWQPYHSQLSSELARIKAQHGVAILWDAHSIASVVPRFFNGKLPDFNFGTADQKSCALELQAELAELMQKSAHATSFSHVFNGRFKGGYITRNYGNPANNIHAVQLEMSQCVYMNETAPFAYRPDLAAQVQPLLSELLAACLSWAKTRSKE
ncbi:N-formylglutamate deformylase [Solimicrobium silvestre]|uniref:N-formylglutamate deformylase n=1 Tax=Solimicrobium silvestre TaxID=2099400 RepID=A0A2S9GZN9_9BURK|nr:N-formylglutamate deformylase [Solimicrobium silvestre]PRC93202.1 N-formylglutamate deformylase [Solimicrobium silvestre]